MKQSCWKMYHHFVKCKYCFQIYKSNAARMDRLLTVIVAIISSASVASWLIWQRWAFVWAAIVAISNLLAILKPYLPYEKRVSSISYMLPELKTLINDVEHYYNFIMNENVSDGDINNQIRIYKQKYTELENKFIDSAIFPDSSNILSKAEILAVDELNMNYHSSIHLKDSSLISGKTSITKKFVINKRADLKNIPKQTPLYNARRREFACRNGHRQSWGFPE